MENLQKKNEQQIKELSTKLQPGLQQFLASSMEQMFKAYQPSLLLLLYQSTNQRPKARSAVNLTQLNTHRL